MRLKHLFYLPFLLLATYTLRGQASNELNLMPWPREITVTEGFYSVRPDFSVFIKGVGSESRVSKATIRFLRFLSDNTGVFLNAGYPVFEGNEQEHSLIIEVGQEVELKQGMDESYELQISSAGIVLKSDTDLGALHGLSTLTQMIEVTGGDYAFPLVQIKDEPRFVWRGLMMDVSRHFMPVDVVKRNLDAMALVKLNVFHWHLSDDQGFRVEIKSLPKLHEKASDGMFYTQAQIKDVVEYADDRGIRVVPEFDVPGHGTAFLTAYPEFASKKGINYSLERNSGIFDPTLDPTNEDLYLFLDTLFREVTTLFPDDYFHIGGDENEGRHWTENPDIQAFMEANKIADNHGLQTYFNIRLEKILNRYGKRLMGWEEIMTPNMPKSALIHSWRGVNEGLQPGESLIKAARNGYQTILSNGYYIDLMLSVDEHYLVDPMPAQELSAEERSRILGGEATMWSELVTPLTIDTRIWPRTAAIAERFWSDQSIRDLDDMHRRLERISQKLEGVGARHLQVRDYLFRNLANYRSTDALRDLADISEPLKIYTRNRGGTEYQVYSPFTLFADACTADAADKRSFKRHVESYLAENDPAESALLQGYLTKWRSIYARLQLIQNEAPLVRRTLPYAKRVRDVAAIVLEGLEKGKLSAKQYDSVLGLLDEEDDPQLNLDVELAIREDIIALAKHLTQG
jgi:hexosaminidase